MAAAMAAVTYPLRGSSEANRYREKEHKIAYLQSRVFVQDMINASKGFMGESIDVNECLTVFLNDMRCNSIFRKMITSPKCPNRRLQYQKKFSIDDYNFIMCKTSEFLVDVSYLREEKITFVQFLFKKIPRFFTPENCAYLRDKDIFLVNLATNFPNVKVLFQHLSNKKFPPIAEGTFLSATNDEIGTAFKINTIKVLEGLGWILPENSLQLAVGALDPELCEFLIITKQLRNLDVSVWKTILYPEPEVEEKEEKDEVQRANRIKLLDVVYTICPFENPESYYDVPDYLVPWTYQKC